MQDERIDVDMDDQEEDIFFDAMQEWSRCSLWSSIYPSLLALSDCLIKFSREFIRRRIGQWTRG